MAKKKKNNKMRALVVLIVLGVVLAFSTAGAYTLGAAINRMQVDNLKTQNAKLQTTIDDKNSQLKRNENQIKVLTAKNGKIQAELKTAQTTLEGFNADDYNNLLKYKEETEPKLKELEQEKDDLIKLLNSGETSQETVPVAPKKGNITGILLIILGVIIVVIIAIVLSSLIWTKTSEYDDEEDYYEEKERKWSLRLPKDWLKSETKEPCDKE